MRWLVSESKDCAFKDLSIYDAFLQIHTLKVQANDKESNEADLERQWVHEKKQRDEGKQCLGFTV